MGILLGAKLHEFTFLSHDTEQKLAGRWHLSKHDGLWKGFPFATDASCFGEGVFEKRWGTRMIWSLFRNSISWLYTFFANSILSAPTNKFTPGLIPMDAIC